ncbi:MAG: hypothetical protein KDH94_08740, partial [Coxiellaceae bacterium]|nr:hypothetical protein [Coxiellaceae bacterium]
MSRPATTPLHGYETFAKADTSVAKQEELKAKLFEAAREEKRHTLFGSKKPEKRSPASVEKLKVLFRSLLENNLYPALIELYDRYRDDPEKADEFKKINNIIKDPVMEDFHAQLIPKGWKRHRVKDQPDNTPDGRHPFNIFAGIYYHKSTRLRSGFIAQYTTMRTTVALGVAALNENESDKAIAYFKEAVEQFTKALQYFIPIIEEDHCYKLRLEDELKKLEQIQDWKDPTQWQQATTSFEQIKADAENVLKRCYKIFELGMKHGDFICYSEANATDRGQLEILRYEDRIRNPNVTSADEL